MVTPHCPASSFIQSALTFFKASYHLHHHPEPLGASPPFCLLMDNIISRNCKMTSTTLVKQWQSSYEIKIKRSSRLYFPHG